MTKKKEYTARLCNAVRDVLGEYNCEGIKPHEAWELSLRLKMQKMNDALNEFDLNNKSDIMTMYETNLHQDFIKFLKDHNSDEGLIFIIDEEGGMTSDGIITPKEMNRAFIELMARVLRQNNKNTGMDYEQN
jgi:hypothetical protein